MSIIDDILSEQDDHENRLEVIENNGYSEVSVQDTQDQLDQITQQIQNDEQVLGQLQSPLSPDTVNLINSAVNIPFTGTFGLSTTNTSLIIVCGFTPNKIFFNGFVAYASNYIVTNGWYDVATGNVSSSYLQIQSGSVNISSTKLGGDASGYITVVSINSNGVVLSVTVPGSGTVAGTITIM